MLNFQSHVSNPRAELLSSKSPRVFISLEAYQRMLLYVEIGQKEVGWLGSVREFSKSDFLIDEVFLLDQVVGDKENVLSADGLTVLVQDLVEQGGDAGLEKANRLRFWGHSHVHMRTCPSDTDERTMGRFSSEGVPWYIRGIFNKHGQARFSIYFYERGYRITDVPWLICNPEAKVIFHSCKVDTGCERPAHWWDHHDRASVLPDGLSAEGWEKLDIPARGLLPDQRLYDEVFSEFCLKVRERDSGARRRRTHC